MSRIKALAEVVRSGGADAMLLTGEVDLIYATGATALEGQCLIFPDETAVFVTDGRYIEYAEAVLAPQGFQVVNRTQSESGIQMVGDILHQRDVRRLMYEDDVLTVKSFAALRKHLEMDYVPVLDGITDLRACKSDEETVSVIKAQRIAEKALDMLLPELKTGITERDAAAKLNYYMALLGSEKPSFETILLFGENTSKPHGVPSDRALKPGDFVLCDFGAVVNGYHSDMTRTFAYASATDEMRTVYETVLAAQTAARNAAVADALCSDMHFAAVKVIEDAGYGEYFTHALGHSVGLEIHEMPVASPHCDQPLKAGVIMTDEPGIYLAGKFGVRIEDMLLITEGAARNLTEYPKEFRILPEQG
ncbi:MAG: aminopeptidase P family protein [Oscillospiraceae bacterium]|nr:aminopeptidase P family protein [Oscillospiraceae bacterium]